MRPHSLAAILVFVAGLGIGISSFSMGGQHGAVKATKFFARAARQS